MKSTKSSLGERMIRVNVDVVTCVLHVHTGSTFVGLVLMRSPVRRMKYYARDYPYLLFMEQNF